MSRYILGRISQCRKLGVETECRHIISGIPQCRKWSLRQNVSLCQVESHNVKKWALRQNVDKFYIHPTMLKMGVETECRDIFYARNSQCRTWSLRQNVNIYYRIAGIKIGHCLKMHYFGPFLLIRLFVYQHVKN